MFISGRKVLGVRNKHCPDKFIEFTGVDAEPHDIDTSPRPFLRVSLYNTSRPLICLQEIIVSSDAPLQLLHNSFKCVTSKLIDEKYLAYFLIDDTFYLDTSMQGKDPLEYLKSFFFLL